MSKQNSDWETHVDGYRLEPRITAVLTGLCRPVFKADPSLSNEIKQLTVFAVAAEATAKHIRGPHDLDAAQSAINEIQSYRDRAVMIWLNAVEIKGKLDRGWYIIQQILYMKAEVQVKNQAVRDAIVGQTAREIEDMSSEWEVIVKQSELLIRNCRDAYNAVHTQVEIAKQMWFQGLRVDASAEPTGQERSSSGKSTGGKPQPLTKQMV